MNKLKLTISALSALLICTSTHAQTRKDSLRAAQLPHVRETITADYNGRTQRNTGIPTVYVDILDGEKDSEGALISVGKDYKYVDGQWKANGDRYNIFMSDGSKKEIGNSDITSDKNYTRNARDNRWNNYFKIVWNGEKDKNYDIARIQVIDASGNMKERDELVRLRGRGNSTWRTAKRSYRLKFPTKTALMAKGDGTNTHADAKSWTLIANAFDKSMIQNALASEIGKQVGLPFNVSYLFVDMYFNNEYWGCYQIADQIAIGGRRINIDEDEGWLLEAVATNTNFLSDPYITVNIPGVGSGTINVKNPEVPNDDASDPKITAIANWLGQVNFSDHSEETGFRKYIDIYSLADYLVVLDITGNYDGCISNYMYKDKGENTKLKFGPIWDNDLSFGNFYGDDYMKKNAHA